MEDQLSSDSEAVEESDRWNPNQQSRLTTTKTKPTQSRGRPKVPPAWSRLLSVRQDADIEGQPEQSQYAAYTLEIDLKPKNALDAAPARRRNQRPWQPYFWPDIFKKEHADLSLAHNQLAELKLKQQAKAVTKIRSRIRKVALAAVAQD
jgi:hypothetical protein